MPGKFKWGSLLALSLFYLANPGHGVFEIIPDNLPLIGNLDEAGAAMLAIKAFQELRELYKKSSKK